VQLLTGICGRERIRGLISNLPAGKSDYLTGGAIFVVMERVERDFESELSGM
jgi:hypothetical protein